MITLSSDKLIRYLEKQKPAMPLMTRELEQTIPEFYSQEDVNNPIVYVHYFSITGWHWYGVEFDKEARMFYGYVMGNVDEWGYFTLAELESCGALIERDLYWESLPIDIIKERRL